MLLTTGQETLGLDKLKFQQRDTEDTWYKHRIYLNKIPVRALQMLNRHKSLVQVLIRSLSRISDKLFETGLTTTPVMSSKPRILIFSFTHTFSKALAIRVPTCSSDCGE